MKRVPKQATSNAAAYFELTKPSITFLILISTALGYYLGGDGIENNIRFLVTLIGSCLVSSGAGALNHFAEMDSDWLMDRTKKRPIPTGMIEREFEPMGIAMRADIAVILNRLLQAIHGLHPLCWVYTIHREKAVGVLFNCSIYHL